MNGTNGSGSLSGKSMQSSDGLKQNGSALPRSGQEPRQNELPPSGQMPNMPNPQEPNPSLSLPSEPSLAGQVSDQDSSTSAGSKSSASVWRNGSLPPNVPQPHEPQANPLELNLSPLSLNTQEQSQNRPNLPLSETEQSDPEAKTRKDALDLWRSLKSVNANLPEDLICDELTAASDASDLQTKSFGDCWLRSRCPMPRLRISDGVSERLILWYSLLEVHVDSTFRIFELYLAGDVVCRIISRKPQEGLYADLQQERVKVIFPVANVSVSFEDLKVKKPASNSSGKGEC